jgi:TPR repeat protein
MEKPWYRKLFTRVRKPALILTRTKADQGDAEAQFAVALRYGAGQGESCDFLQAAQWYRKAADQNHSLAQFNLGIMYAKGQGVERDDVQAAAWIRKAAEQGDAGAQYNMGTRCHSASLDGLKTEAGEAKIEAYKWLHLASAQGYKDSDAAFERVTLGMTREEVSEGIHRVSLFPAARVTSTAS